MNSCFVSISFSLAIILLFGAGSAHSAKVMKKNAAKNTILVDVGSRDGLRPGSKVCFYSKQGKAACGQVVGVKPRMAIVRVSRSGFRKVQKGMVVRPERGARGRSKGGTSRKAGSASGGSSFFIRGLYIASFASPAQFSTVSYEAPTESTDSLWKSDGQAGGGLVGLGIEGSMRIMGDFLVSAGLRFRQTCKLDLSCSFGSDADYVAGDSTQFARTSHEGNAFGLWSEFLYILNIGQGHNLFLGGGLDFEQSSLSFKATQINDASGEESSIASASSSVLVVSLRLTPKYELALGPLALHVGLPLYIPIMALSESFSGTVDDPNKELFADAPGDLEGAINHGPGGFGVELQLGMSFLL